MTTSASGEAAHRMKWYRCTIELTTLRELTRRSDTKGLFYSLGNLLLVAATAYLTYFFYVREIWLGFGLALWLHGTIRTVATSAHHELAHGTVFKSKWLGALFLRIWSLLLIFNYHRYSLSHTYHHLYTLHDEADGEVVLPIKLPSKVLKWLQLFTFNFEGFFRSMTERIRLTITGKYRDEWTVKIFTPKYDATFKRAIRLERILLGLHVAVFIVSAIFELWIIPVLLTLGMYIGHWWGTLIGSTMHTGLRDNVPDFRLCCRTIKLDPFSGFVYWGMHYHIEHHMFAAVPCYNLGKLYRSVATDMPERRTLIGAWKEMVATQKRQRNEPEYQFDTPLPQPKDDAATMDPLRADIGDLKPRDFVESPPKSI
ncbi:MAG: fatty acid desaturase [Spirochaetales bacterium]|nr:fatty acid desaturase [Spirochaetales bacterium]